MICALHLGCGGDPTAGTQGGDSSGATTHAAGSTTTTATGSTPTTTGASEGATGGATEGATGGGASTSTSTGEVGVSSDATGVASTGTDDGTGADDATGTSTSGGPECPVQVDSTAKPLVDPLSESSPTLFVRPDGYHIIHIIQTPDFETRLVKLDLDGQVVGAPFVIGDDIWRHKASNGDRYAAVTTTTGNAGHHGTIVVSAIEADDTLTLVNTTPVPAPGWGSGTIAVAWNPVDGEWGVLWEDQYNVDPNKPGYIHARLAFGRVSADGVWVKGSTKLLTSDDTKSSVSLSDWTNPLIWAGDRYAAVWAEFGPVTSVYLGELAADGTPTRTKIDEGSFSRGVVAWDGVGYGVAWGHTDVDHYNMRFVYVSGGAVGEVLHLGDDQIYSNEASIVAADGRFTVAWHETAADRTRVYYAKIDPGTLDAETVEVTEPNFAGHDWAWNLVHDGCRHALSHMHGINPSDGWVRLFD